MILISLTNSSQHPDNAIRPIFVWITGQPGPSATLLPLIRQNSVPGQEATLLSQAAQYPPTNLGSSSEDLRFPPFLSCRMAPVSERPLTSLYNFLRPECRPQYQHSGRNLQISAVPIRGDNQKLLIGNYPSPQSGGRDRL